MAGEIISSIDMSLSRLRETAEDREAWRAAVHGVTESDSTEGSNNEQQLRTKVTNYEDV